MQFHYSDTFINRNRRIYLVYLIIIEGTYNRKYLSHTNRKQREQWLSEFLAQSMRIMNESVLWAWVYLRT